jgi:AraC-like DNA-binding protein
MEERQSTVPSIEFSPTDSPATGIELIELEELSERLPTLNLNPTKPHRVNFYILIYITRGEGVHSIDFKSYPYKEGDFLFISNQQVHAFDLKSRAQGKVIMFSQSFAEQISARLNVPIFVLDYLVDWYTPLFTVNPSLTATCEVLLDEIIKEKNESLSDEFVVQLLFSSLFLKLMRERPKNNVTRLSKKQITQISLFLYLLEKHYVASRNASFYADLMGITYKTLNQLCKLASQKTAKQLIDAYTILEAKRKLIVDDVSINEVSDKLGFEEVTNFIKYFKKHTQKTPSQFKRFIKG